MEIMPNMLQQFKETRHGSPCSLGEEYVNEDGILCNDSCHEEWDKILEEMIFLFSEMNEDTCQKKNIYEKEHEKVSKEFEEKYGIFGEKLEKHNNNHENGIRVHLPSEFPEYKDIEERYYDYEKELVQYRESCKDKAFVLFAKWFYSLWDR